MALPFNDGLVVVSRDGAVVALDAAGRRLWQALQAGCTVDHLIGACVAHGGIPHEVARANISSAFRAWRALGLTAGSDQGAPATPAVTQVVTRPNERVPALEAVHEVGERPVRVGCDDVVLGEVIDAACGSCRVSNAAAALACVAVAEQDDGLAVSAEETMLARTGAPRHDRALARHRCLTAVLDDSARPAAAGDSPCFGRQHRGALRGSRRRPELWQEHACRRDGRSGRRLRHRRLRAPRAGKLADLARASRAGDQARVVACVAAAFARACFAPRPQACWPADPLSGSGAWRRAVWHRGSPVEALVFPSCEKGAGLRKERIAADEAFARPCHARSMLNRQPDVLADTLRWVGSVPAYRLVYGVLDRAVGSVLCLLHHK